MPSTLRIAILLSPNTPWQRAVMTGIPLYKHQERRWVFNLMRPDAHGANQLRKLKPDGAIGSFSNSLHVDVVKELNIPAVTITENIRFLDLPCVILDGIQTGKMAADHLMDNGLHHFAYAGWRGHGGSFTRFEGFNKRLQERAHKPETIDLGDFSTDQPEKQLMEWLPKLPKPIGIFAFNDITAAAVIDAAYQLDLRIPEDIAVIGVDNDESICTLINPPISSIQPRPKLIGQLAAEMLDALLSGKRPANTRILVPPRSVIERASTDHIAITDPQISKAVRYIRDHVAERINVTEVARSVAVGRRVMEQGFRKQLGHSPLEEIQRARMKIAKRLLADTYMSLVEVAETSGFRDLNHMSRAFRERLETTPATYRQKFSVAARDEYLKQSATILS